MNFLVVGGAGYIGSHMVKLLMSEGHTVTVVDNFSTGHRDATCGARVVECDLCDTAMLRDLFRQNRFDGVFHFASSIQVAESVRKPEVYYRNNFVNSLNLIEAMRAQGADRLIFSSSAAVYGEPQRIPIDERHPTSPINPYGMSKLMVERLLFDMERAYGMRSVALRYFNAAGAEPGGALGERHDPETHLIPLVLQTAAGKRPAVRVFGEDYETPDGTCVRDYIHVTDLCRAHFLALKYLAGGGATDVFNLGNGQGFSVRNVIDTARRITGREIRVEHALPRPGDVARLIADASRARKILGWQPVNTALERIIEDAWRWECRSANGG